MLRILIAKEMHDSLVSLRFLLALILTVAVFIVSAFLFVKQHRDRVADYDQQSMRNTEQLHEQAQALNQLAGNNHYLIRTPHVTELFAAGGEKYLPDRIGYAAFRYGMYSNIDRQNYKLRPFAELDWVFVVGIVLSFVALVFTFDRISGEKQFGTLRLQCSNSLSRLQIIVAKYIASVVLLGIPLLLGLLLNLIIVSIALRTALIISSWAQILILLFLFALYLSFFSLLGLFVSSRVQRPATSLAISLLIWTTVVVFIPAGGGMLGQKIKKIPTSYEYNQKWNASWDDIWMNAPVPEARGYWDGRDFPFLKERAELVNRFSDNNNKFREHRFRDLLSQVRTAQNLTRISPYASLRYLGESIAGTGVDALVRFYEHGKLFRTIFRQFVVDKDAVDPDSYHHICAWHPEAYSDKPVAYEEIPEFTAPAHSIGKAVGRSKVDILLLSGFNLLAAVLCFVAFVKYDVR